MEYTVQILMIAAVQWIIDKSHQNLKRDHTSMEAIHLTCKWWLTSRSMDQYIDIFVFVDLIAWDDNYWSKIR